ncbi:MAG: hypothetical protein EOP10_29885 [Proteobacteria bacterium]|nr:MAG: hypothetical protein EOP10_29885 [Pseudomonadota bacterium]
MSTIRTLSQTLLPAFIALAAAQSFAGDLHPPQGSVKIKSIDPKGSGCPSLDSASSATRQREN